MPSVKQQAIDLINRLPDNCTLEDIQYHLYVREKVERGLSDMADGKTISQEEAENRIRSWLESSGQNQH